MRKILILVGMLVLAFSSFAMEIKVGKTDMECSLLILKKEPRAKILSSMGKEYEMASFSDGSLVFVKGKSLKNGGVYLILSRRSKLPHGSSIYRMAGYGKVLRFESGKAVVKVEKTCTAVHIGDYLISFVPEEEFVLKVPPIKEETVAPEGPSFSIVYIESGFHQIGDGSWAVVNAGEKEGLKKGVVLSIFRELDGVKKPISKAVVIRTFNGFSVVRFFSAIDAVKKGDLAYKGNK